MDRGLRTFLVIWAGQVVSILGTSMTRFALLIWAYQQTGEATTLALLGFFSFVTTIAIAPFAGVWVDRWDRRRVMMVSDLNAGVITLITLALYVSGHLAIWHLYATAALTGIFEGFQQPAYNSAMSILVPVRHLTRANGLRTLSGDLGRILSPALAGLVLYWAGLAAVMLVDIATFGIAMITLLTTHIPRPPESADGRATQGLSVRAQMAFGVRFIAQRPGLLGLLVLFMLIHLFAALAYFGILPAMILARSGGDELVLSGVQSALGIGGVAGGIILAIWGGPRRKIHGVLGYCAASFLFGDLLFALGRTPAAWVVAAITAAGFIPFISSANRTIWQMKVPPDVQGRVLSTAFSLQQITTPIGFLIAGPLADRVFEPAMMPGGALNTPFGALVGTGPGAGMGLMFLGTATFGTVICLSGYLFPALRNVERDLPDYVSDAPDSRAPELAQDGIALAAAMD